MYNLYIKDIRMSSIVYLKNKTNGKVYAYLNESEWDPATKRCRCRRKCLGHVDPVTGDIVPNRGHGGGDAAEVLNIGATRLFDHIAESIGLKSAVSIAMPEKAPLILSCVYYLMEVGGPLVNIRYWSEENRTPYRRAITTDVLAELMQGISENDLFSFFREWRDRSEDKGFYTLHLSSTAYYDSGSDRSAFGGLAGQLTDTKTHMSIEFGAESKMPIAYGQHPSPPKNLTELRRRMSDMIWLDMPDPIHVLDTDYCTQDNFRDLLASNTRFILRSPPSFPFSRDAIVRVKDRIMDTKNMVTVDGSTVFIMSFVNYLDGRKCFAHIMFSAEEAEEEFSIFLSLIEQCYRELIKNVYVKEHQEFYDRYFIITETEYGRSVERNGDAMMDYNDVAGFSVVLSNSVKDPVAAYRYYTQKDKVRIGLENLKNRADRSPLKLYSDEVYRGRLFIQFLTVILQSAIRRRMRGTSLLNNITIRDVIHQMSMIRRISIPGFDTPFYTNLNNIQTRILSAFGIDPAELKGR